MGSGPAGSDCSQISLCRWAGGDRTPGMPKETARGKEAAPWDLGMGGFQESRNFEGVLELVWGGGQAEGEWRAALFREHRLSQRTVSM